jgi:hypothetical protein
MKTINEKLLIILLSGMMFFYACKKNDTENQPQVNGEYVLCTTSSFISPTGNIQKVGSLDTITSINNNNSLEYMTSGMYSYGNMLFSCNYTDNYIVRLKINDAGKIEEDVKIDVGGKTGKIWFKDSHTAYTYENSTFKIRIFDPTEMILKGQIDLSMLKRSDVPFMELYDIIERNGKLFVPINLALRWHSTAIDSVYIAVADVASLQFEKIIKSGMSQTAGGALHSCKAMAIDENKDIYFTAHLSNGTGGSSKPSGLMRIKSGATDFDDTYFWNLTEATNNHRADAFYYIGNGKAFITVGYPELLNPNNNMSLLLDPVFKWWFIDLKAKSAIELDLPVTKGFNTSWAIEYNKNYLLPIANNEETAIYEYSLTQGKQIRKIGTNGEPISFIELNTKK